MLDSCIRNCGEANSNLALSSTFSSTYALPLHTQGNIIPLIPQNSIRVRGQALRGATVSVCNRRRQAFNRAAALCTSLPCLHLQQNVKLQTAQKSTPDCISKNLPALLHACPQGGLRTNRRFCHGPDGRGAGTITGHAWCGSLHSVGRNRDMEAPARAAGGSERRARHSACHRRARTAHRKLR